MGDTAAKQGVAPCGDLIHVRVEMISGECGEALNVSEGHLALLRIEAVADDERSKGNPERVRLRIALARAAHPAPGHGRKDVRCALQRGALHIVQHAANAAQLLAAARATGAAVDEMRQRRAMTRGLGCAGCVDDENTAVKRRKTCHQARCRRVIGTEDRGDEAAAAAPRERDRILKAGIR